jgi:Ca2+-binding RTX toxin-like protein
MATFTAHTAFDMSVLSMAGLFDFTGTSSSETLVRLFDDDTHYAEFTGVGFVFDPQGQIVGGTLTGISLVFGTPVFDMAGLDVPAATFNELALAGDNDGALALLFAGWDTVRGSSGADVLLGYDGNDVLRSYGGLDTLVGGPGDDMYLVQAGDVLVEAAGEGIDQVTSLVSWTLGAALENLTLNGTAGVAGTGNALANALFGNASNNLLRGLGGKDTLTGGGGKDVLDGGAGFDRLEGNGGADVYRFASPIAGTPNIDQVVGFVSGTDTLRLDDDVFTGLAAGALDAGAFVAGLGLTAGQDAGDRIVYNTSTGRLFYDADGSGPGAAVAFAALGAGTTLLASDIFIVN